MNKRTFTIGALVVALLLAVGGLYASNMGFKLNYPLQAAGAGATGTNTIALPFNRQAGIDNAEQLVNDIGSVDVINLQKYDEATGGLILYPGTNFSLAAGEAYFIRMQNNVDYIVVGSHDPSFAVQLDAAGGGGSPTGTNFFAYVYHATAADAEQLRNDIGSVDVINIQQYDTATGGLNIFPPTNFTCSPGEGYFIRMQNTVSYVPSHY